MTAPHRYHRPARVVAAGLAIAALAAPPALAKPDIGQVHRDTGGATTAEPAPTAPDPGPVIVRVPDGGFDWGSAAIGAGGAGAVVLLLSLGGTALVSRHRMPPVAP